MKFAYDLRADGFLHTNLSVGAAYTSEHDQANIGFYGNTETLNYGCVLWVNGPMREQRDYIT